MLTDLRRPHAFAHERVGFLVTREAQGADGEILILAKRYEPVREDEYMEDGCVGARINRDAIRRMMQHALDGDGIFHVHLHEARGTPSFSSVDRENLEVLVPSFCAAAPQVAHGALLLSSDDGIAHVWWAGGEGPSAVSRVSIVGYPLRCWRNGHE